MKIGCFLSSEESSPAELVERARLAEQAGFEALSISDHFHPWSEEQGHSPFVWSAIGAIAEATDLPVSTAVTCPTVRIHPAIVAHAAATCALLCERGFTLGVGSGEALNEHILGDRWPAADERLEMLEESVEVMRALWRGGDVTHQGRHYRVENARIYDLPAQPPPVLVSGFGPKSIALAARIGDGFCTVQPDADAVAAFREQGGGEKPVIGMAKVCFGPDETAARAEAHRLWPNDPLPGELAQLLPSVAHFEQASALVDEQMVAEAIPCGPDLEAQIEHFERYRSAGFDELYVQQVGELQEPFFQAYADEVIPSLRETVKGA